MTTPYRSRLPASTRWLLLLTSCAFAAAVCIFTPVLAAAGAAVTHTYFTITVALSDVKSQATTTEAPGSSSSKPGAPGSGSSNYGGSGFGGGRSRGGAFGGSGNTGTSDFNSQSDVTYTITVRNITKFPVKNLVVEYHFYNLTTNTGSDGLTTHSVQDITGTENVDIDASSISKPIITKPIRRADSASTSHSFGPSSNSGGGRTYAGKTTTRESSSITDLIGYRVETRYNNELVGSTESPMDLKDKLASYAPAPDTTASAGAPSSSAP